MSFGAVALEDPEGAVLPDGSWPCLDFSFVCKQVCLNKIRVMLSPSNAFCILEDGVALFQC